jgi:hypothetical protein
MVVRLQGGYPGSMHFSTVSCGNFRLVGAAYLCLISVPSKWSQQCTPTAAPGIEQTLSNLGPFSAGELAVLSAMAKLAGFAHRVSCFWKVQRHTSVLSGRITGERKQESINLYRHTEIGRWLHCKHTELPVDRGLLATGNGKQIWPLTENAISSIGKSKRIGTQRHGHLLVAETPRKSISDRRGPRANICSSRAPRISGGWQCVV